MKYYISTPKIEFMPISIRREDGLWIPVDERNCNYRQYLEWIEEGNAPEPWIPEENE